MKAHTSGSVQKFLTPRLKDVMRRSLVVAAALNVILCSEKARRSPLLSASGEGRLQRSGTWYLEAVIGSLGWVEGWLF